MELVGLFLGLWGFSLLGISQIFSVEIHEETCIYMINIHISPHCFQLDEDFLNGKITVLLNNSPVDWQGGSYHWSWVD